MSSATIRDNLRAVQAKIGVAAAKAGRKTDEITLVGVSKTHPASAIQEAYSAGLRHFGENRVQEWEGKHGEVASLDATWHLIGHLQSNKAARAAKAFHCIDSIDDGALAQRVERALAEGSGERKMRVLIEVHLGGEESKTGVAESDLPALAEEAMKLPHVELGGLMCIPPYLEDMDKVRPFFARLRELRDQLVTRIGHALPVLSMGMSHDFEAAIQEGATEVRVGTAIFGIRPSAK
jgi:pyridoxal phosphate enzyme (YggS family)